MQGRGRQRKNVEQRDRREGMQRSTQQREKEGKGRWRRKKGGNRDRGRLRGEMKSGDVGGRGAEKRGTEGG